MGKGGPAPKSGPVDVYIGLGSNLGEPEKELGEGLLAMARIKGYATVKVSSPYRTSPVGPQDQPPFLNAVAMGRFQGAPERLLEGLLSVEAERGRVRKRRWGPRVLDLDILLFGGEVIDLPRLKVPHPEMPNRLFVLAPLDELAPELVLPCWEMTARQLMDHIDPSEIAAQKIERLPWAFGAF